MILTDQQIAPIDIQTRKKGDFTVGDTVRVHQKITEKDKTRTQVFEGTVIARKHGTEPGATFTVRRVGTDAIAVEKIFPLFSPMIERIETIRKVKTRRAKLYFLRGRTPRQIREKLRKALHLPEDPQETEPEQKEKEPSQEQSPSEEQSAEEKPPQNQAPSEEQSEEKASPQNQASSEEQSEEKASPQNQAPAEEQSEKEETPQEQGTQEKEENPPKNTQ